MNYSAFESDLWHIFMHLAPSNLTKCKSVIRKLRIISSRRYNIERYWLKYKHVISRRKSWFARRYGSNRSSSVEMLEHSRLVVGLRALRRAWEEFFETVPPRWVVIIAYRAGDRASSWSCCCECTHTSLTGCHGNGCALIDYRLT